MRRREFIGLLGSTVIAWPGCSSADWSGRVWRVGILGSGPGDQDVRELEKRLGDLGYVQDKNIVLVNQVTGQASKVSRMQFYPSFPILIC
jgi:hypothetical protein